MPRSFRAKAAVFYWIATIMIACFWSYSEQKDFRDICTVTKGEVIDQVYVRQGRHDVLAPQIVYRVGEEELYFADKSINWLELGDEVEVIYQNTRPDNVYVYDFSFWINYRVIILTALIAFVGFGLIWGLTQKFPKGEEILPSNIKV